MMEADSVKRMLYGLYLLKSRTKMGIITEEFLQ